MNRRDFLIQNFWLLASLSSCKRIVDSRISSDNIFRYRPEKRVDSLVVLLMAGGPSHLDLFDYKPALYEKDGKSVKIKLGKAKTVEEKILKPIGKFAQYGQSGQWFSDLSPGLSSLADDLLFIKSLRCNSFEHKSAQIEVMTGSDIPNLQPYIGSWIGHQLQRQDSLLPNSLIFNNSGATHHFNLDGAPEMWSHGGLSSVRSQVVFESFRFAEGEKKLEAMGLGSRSLEEVFLRYLRDFDEKSRYQKEKFLRDRTHLFELVFSTRDELMKIIKNIKFEKKHRELYRINSFGENFYADLLILTIELIKRKIPYIQINDLGAGDEGWDNHYSMEGIRKNMDAVDYPTAGFIKDLKLNGLDKKTIVLWGGEFGRSPTVEDGTKGRDHNIFANTVWLFGEGVKKGHSYGATDPLGHTVVQNPLEYADIWATACHLMGINHEYLFYEEEKRKISLTKKHHRVVTEILS